MVKNIDGLVLNIKSDGCLRPIFRLTGFWQNNKIAISVMTGAAARCNLMVDTQSG